MIILWLPLLMISSQVHISLHHKSSSVVFGDLQEQHKLLQNLENPSEQCTMELGVCVSHVQHYPSRDVIRNAIDRSSLLDVIRSQDLATRSSRPTERIINNMVEICSTQERVLFPLRGQDADGVFHFIVNKDDFKQPVHVNACKEPDKKARVLQESSRCVQQNKLVNLIVLNGTNGAEMRPMKMPSHCACLVQENILGERFGNTFAQPPPPTSPRVGPMPPSIANPPSSAPQSSESDASSTDSRQDSSIHFDGHITRRSAAGAAGAGARQMRANLHPDRHIVVHDEVVFSETTTTTAAPPKTEMETVEKSDATPPGNFISEITAHSNSVIILKQPQREINL